MFAGHATLQGACPLFRIPNLLGVAWAYSLAIARLVPISTVELIGHVHRAGIRTLTAGSAFGFINISGRDLDSGLKIARLSFQADEFGKGEYLNIYIAGAFDQFGRYDTGSAIAGGECLVKVGHHAADGRITLHKINFKSGIGEVEGRLNAGDTAALNQNCTC